MKDQFFHTPKAVRICYRRYGQGRPILLITGLGLQQIYWPPELIEGLMAQGFEVITLDNRDSGRSSHIDTPPPSNLQKMLRMGRAQDYDLSDMAGDGFALLDHLGLEAAHVMGMSMGGMIAQEMAVIAPRRVLSLTSVYSTTGARWVGLPALGPIRFLLRKVGPSEAEAVAAYLEIMGLVAGPDYGLDRARAEAYARAAFARRAGDPSAALGRQLMAIFKSGDRTKRLRSVTCPTCVIHGDYDAMVATSGGRATAKAIRGARLVIVKGVGHDVSVPSVGPIIEAICDLTKEVKHV